MEIYLNDNLTLSKIIEHPEKIKVLIKEKGLNIIRFYSPDGCQRPIEITEIKSSDRRCLSFAFRNVSIEPLTPWNFLDIGTKDSEPYLIDGWSENEISNNTTYVWANSLSSSVLIVLDKKSS